MSDCKTDGAGFHIDPTVGAPPSVTAWMPTLTDVRSASQSVTSSTGGSCRVTAQKILRIFRKRLDADVPERYSTAMTNNERFEARPTGGRMFGRAIWAVRDTKLNKWVGSVTSIPAVAVRQAVLKNQKEC